MYSPNDLARVKVRIIGDPAWIQQGSIFAGVEPANFNFNAFNPDGTINFDSNQIMFEIAWQRPEDYDPSTGLADPYSGGYSGTANAKRKPIQSNVYQAHKVTSEFRNGRFEQTLEGGLYTFPKPDKSNTVSPTNSRTDPEQERLRQAQQAPGSGSNYAADQRRLAAAQAAPGSGSSYRSSSPAQLKSAVSAASSGANSPMPAPAPPSAISSNPGGDYDGGITTDVSNAPPATPPESNGETVGPASNFSAPPKIGESDTPQVGTSDLGDFFG